LLVVDADEPSRWYRYCESYVVVIALIGAILWGIAARPHNSDLLLINSIVTACLGSALLLVGLTGHRAATLRRGNAKLEEPT
jgi:hypothetical protein